MCPLRIFLIFISATLAGFLLLRGLNDPSPSPDRHPRIPKPSDSSNPPSRSSKILAAFSSGFWTCVDMASGRYLWRSLSALKKSAAD